MVLERLKLREHMIALLALEALLWMIFNDVPLHVTRMIDDTAHIALEGMMTRNVALQLRPFASLELAVGALSLSRRLPAVSLPHVVVDLPHE